MTATEALDAAWHRYAEQYGYGGSLAHKVTFVSGWTAAGADALKRIEAAGGPQRKRTLTPVTGESERSVM